jgi:DNA-binding helix-hairpin-helix protein with protein kinase domain
MLKANLLAWRQCVEQSFLFDPNEPPDPADVRVVEQQIEQKKTELVQALSNGPTGLKQLLHSWQAERVSAIANVDLWKKTAAQAEANYKALGRI